VAGPERPGRRPNSETGESGAQQREAVFISWANTTDRSARTAKARAARDAKRLAAHDGDPKRAEAARKAELIAMGRKSGAVRKARADASQPDGSARK
jgi:hypothetical protein